MRHCGDSRPGCLSWMIVIAGCVALNVAFVWAVVKLIRWAWGS